MKRLVLSLFLICLIAGTGSRLHAQVDEAPPADEGPQTEGALAPLDPIFPSEDRLRIYLDCQRCDMAFIRTEIGFVDYVRERQDAHVHVLVTTQPTGVGGTEYALQFIGLGRFQGLIDDLRFTSTVMDSQDQVRRGMTQVLKGGLVRYAVRTPLAQRMNLSFAPPPSGTTVGNTTTVVQDRWNRWIFRTSLGGSTSAEASYKSLNLNASASANRVTSGWKTGIGFNTRTSTSNTKVRDNWVANEQRDHSVRTLMVKSISNHWSVGGRTNANHSTFQNRNLSLRVAPVLEFNVFPYSESTRRQLTLQYSVGANQVEYIEETIYDRTGQFLVDEALGLSFDTRQPWGSGNIGLEASHYFHDKSKYRLQADASVDLRIYRGLSLNLSTFAQRIHDQLHLVKGDLSDEQILLRQRQIATSFRYNAYVGFGYSFGSIFSGEVNPRIGNLGGGGGGGGG